jgi:membrane protein DedA with SNARE-associated domain
MSADLFILDNVKEIARDYGYWAVFIGIALENTGIPLPGETITIVGGFLAGSGELNYWWVLLSTIAGAVLGDNFGYWIGKTGGWQLLVTVGNWFGIKEERLEITRERYSQNAAQAVFFGRFVTLLRIFAAPLAGIANMPYPQFLLCNLGGATIWAGTIVTVAYFLGKFISLERIISLIAQFSTIAFIVIAIIILAPIIWEYSHKKLLPKD